MLSEIEDLARRLEQQIKSFEKLHADEMKAFQTQLETLQRIQNEELQTLRVELIQLKEEIAALKQAEDERVPSAAHQADSVPVEKKVTRRDVLTGNILSLKQRRAQ